VYSGAHDALENKGGAHPFQGGRRPDTGGTEITVQLRAAAAGTERRLQKGQAATAPGTEKIALAAAAHAMRRKNQI